MPLPLPLTQIAAQFKVELKAVEAEMTRLGVSVFQFLDKPCVYEHDIFVAHHRSGETSIRADRVGNVARVLEDLRRRGCIVAPMKMEEARRIDCFQLRHKDGGDKPIAIKIQVCSKIQRGDAIHFNLGTPLLKDPAIDWVIMVAPPFAPDSDFFALRRHLYREAKERGYLNKPSFPKRLKARNNPDPFLRTNPLEMLIEEGGNG